MTCLESSEVRAGLELIAQRSLTLCEAYRRVRAA